VPDVLRQRVDQALQTIRDTVEELHDAAEAPYSPDAPVLRLVTSLAEGSDRIAAHAARALGFELQVILPFREEDYERDFDDGSGDGGPSIREFRELRRAATAVTDLDASPGARTRYAAAGLSLVRQCDVLLAIWDGEPTEGPGGSADNVAEAARLGLPVIWIDAHGPTGHEMGLVHSRAGVLEREPWSVAALRSRVRYQLLLAEPPVPEGHAAEGDASPREEIAAFLSPEEPPEPAIPVFRLASRVFSAGSRRVEPPSGKADLPLREPTGVDRKGLPPADAFVRDVWRCLPAAEWTEPARELVEQLRRLFGAAFLRADRRAVLLATVYRNDMTWLYLAAGLGGLLAALGVVLGGDGAVNWAFVLAIGEAAVLGWIWYLYDSMTSRRLHERWLDYRFIAEKLRHVVILAPLGSPSLEIPLPPTLDAADERSHWSNWYLRALLREAGVLPVRLSDERVRRACRALLHHWLVVDQARYHFQSAVRTGTIHSRIQMWRNAAFAATVVLALVHAVLALVPHELRPPGAVEVTLSAFSVVLPVAAAALHAFANQLDLDGTARRSTAELARLRTAWRELVDDTDRSSPELMRITSLVSESMLGELVEWRLDLVSKPPLLP
jgi:hypothetical protein